MTVDDIRDTSGVPVTVVSCSVPEYLAEIEELVVGYWVKLQVCCAGRDAAMPRSAMRQSVPGARLETMSQPTID